MLSLPLSSSRSDPHVITGHPSEPVKARSTTLGRPCNGLRAFAMFIAPLPHDGDGHDARVRPREWRNRIIPLAC
jgi:hypothetical protein